MKIGDSPKDDGSSLARAVVVAAFTGEVPKLTKVNYQVGARDAGSPGGHGALGCCGDGQRRTRQGSTGAGRHPPWGAAVDEVRARRKVEREGGVRRGEEVVGGR